MGSLEDCLCFEQIILRGEDDELDFDVFFQVVHLVEVGGGVHAG